MKFKPGTILSVFSFSISLFVLGFYVMVLLHVTNLVEIVNEKTPFVIELSDSLTSQELNNLKSELELNENILTTEYLSKEDGLKLLQNQFGKEILVDGEDNPLKNILKLKLKNDFIQAGGDKTLIDALTKKPEVVSCSFEKESIEKLKSNLLSLNSILLFLGLLFIIVSFILIYNNLKFILHADRFTIKTMELIGASPSFVKRPYVKLSLKIGFYSGLIATIILGIVLLFFSNKYNIFDSIVDIKIVIIIIVGIFFIGIILPPIFINSLVRKYLMQSDQHRYNQ